MKAVGVVLDTLLPSACVACSRGVPVGFAVCAICRTRFPRLPRPRCDRCSEPVARSVAVTGDGEPDRCEGCLDWPDALDRVAVEFAFHGSASRSLKALKFGGWRGVAPAIATAMLPALDRVLGSAAAAPRGVVLVPVPLAAARFRERGFNQSDLLARELGQARRIGVSNQLVRHPGGDRQARVPRSGRAGNVSGRFGLRPEAGCMTGSPGGLAVLVDDVLTTGSTLGACAELLVEAGFSRVAAVTFARTLRPLEGAPDAKSRLQS